MIQVGDFAAFHEEVHGHGPFPWQQDLVQEVVERRSWPSLVDVPTGLGKTSLLDIAVFANALDALTPGCERIGRRRTFFVVDRRIVVDQAHQHASRIQTHLRGAVRGSASWEVADRLRHLSRTTLPDELLPVVKMRGGATWDAAWLKSPDLTGIITGTVDQVGSRLFFRGYGVSRGRKPIDAALAGMDALILVDEAHLATTLTTSLTDASQHDRPSERLGVPRSQVIQLTATSRDHSGAWATTFDEQSHLDHPVASARLTAAKHLRLETATRTSAPKVLAKAASEDAQAPSARVLVVCNTIDRARAVHAELIKHLPSTTQLSLLIGRSRGLDREPVVDRVTTLFGADRKQCASSAVLVATQTVEVGIDLDATSLVTEIAAWDALVQRIGRVNRRGLRQEASVLVVDDGDPKAPVYGSARAVTAQFIQKLLDRGILDVSPLALRRLLPPEGAFMAVPTAPLLLPAHLNAWSRTSPMPVNDAPVAPYLHGLDTGVAPLTLVWRDGLLNSDATEVSQDEADQLIDAIPVRAEECVDVPVAAVRAWLTGQKPVPVSDWDDDDDFEPPFSDQSRGRVLRRRTLVDGTASWQWARAAQLRPGDSVVIPSELGGLDQFGWAPDSTAKVVDLAELAALERGQAALRLDENLPERLGLTAPDPDLWELVWEWRGADDPENQTDLGERCVTAVRKWLETAAETCSTPWTRGERRTRLVNEMDAAELRTGTSRGKPSNEQNLLPIAVMSPDRPATRWKQSDDDSPDGTVNLARPVSLARHGAAVGTRAEEIGRALTLPQPLLDVLVDAARWHDVGKVDPRFQAMLFGGDPVSAAVASEPLAKSGMPPEDIDARRAAQARSGLPSGARHEAWSERLVADYLSLREEPYAGDVDLLLHLIASHHGHARPFLPPVLDPATHKLEIQVDDVNVISTLPSNVDLAAADRFHDLNMRYGRWGLALLETIVRCADTTVSGEGS